MNAKEKIIRKESGRVFFFFLSRNDVNKSEKSPNLDLRFASPTRWI